MKLQPVDFAMIIAYLVMMLMVGWFLRKKARLNKESYLMFLRNNDYPAIYKLSN